MIARIIRFSSIFLMGVLLNAADASAQPVEPAVGRTLDKSVDVFSRDDRNVSDVPAVLTAKEYMPQVPRTIDVLVAQREAPDQPASSSRLPGSELSSEKVRELERQRDQVRSSFRRKPIGDSINEVLSQEKMNLQKENTLLTNAANLLKFIQIPPTPDPCSNPQIKTTDVTLPIEPLEEIILNGCGFGDQRGELRLEGNVFPSGHVKLDIFTWTRKAIHARVPSLKGVPNAINTKMRVVRKDLVLGDPFDMPFKATVSCELIAPQRVTVLCAEPGNCLKDDELSKKNFNEPFEAKLFKDASFGAWHRRAQPFNAGADKAMVNLGLGWRLQGMDYEWGDGGPTNGTQVIVGLPMGFQYHATKFTITMTWTSWYKGEAVYGVKLLACGPWGVPY